MTGSKSAITVDGLTIFGGAVTFASADSSWRVPDMHAPSRLATVAEDVASLESRIMAADTQQLREIAVSWWLLFLFFTACICQLCYIREFLLGIFLKFTYHILNCPI